MSVYTLKARPALGSSSWVLEERDTAQQFVNQELEEFAFSAHNEMDWLNEHMDEIFRGDHINVVDIFKTPGKLRGKTPRTARKRGSNENRAPLTDVFTSNLQVALSSTQNIRPHKNITTFIVAEDPAVVGHQEAYSPNPNAQQEKAVSSFHKESNRARASLKDSKDKMLSIVSPKADNQESPRARIERQSSVASLNSADQMSISRSKGKIGKSTAEEPENEDLESQMAKFYALHQPAYDRPKQNWLSNLFPVSAASHEPQSRPSKEPSQSPITGPAQQSLVRKSSVNFPSLPAREPLVSKNSMGQRASRSRHQNGQRASFVDSQSDKSDKNEAEFSNNDFDDIDTDDEGPELDQDGDFGLALRNPIRSSTQQLHDRISMLGQSQPSRQTKSTATTIVSSEHQYYPDLAMHPDATTEKLQSPSRGHRHNPNDDEDDWIPPVIGALAKALPKIKNDSTQEKPLEDIANNQRKGSLYASGKSSAAEDPTTTTPPSSYALPHTQAAIKDPNVECMKSQEVGKQASHSEIFVDTQASVPKILSTTPLQTPNSRKFIDGAIVSASKSKLTSIFKSARGIFASSAGASAQAKMETISREPARDLQQNSENPSALGAPRGKYHESGDIEMPDADTPVQPPAILQALHNPQPPSQKPNDSKRPIKPSKEDNTRSKPTPVSILVGTHSQREQRKLGQNQPTTALLASSLHESLAPPTTKQQFPGTNVSSQTRPSNTNFRTAPTATLSKPKASANVTKKREQDDREVQRKLKLKLEAEAKREEARKRELQQRRDAERLRDRERLVVDNSKQSSQRPVEKGEYQRTNPTQGRVRSRNDNLDNATILPSSKGDKPPAKPGFKTNFAANARPAREEFTRSVNAPQPNPAGPRKRLFLAEGGDELLNRPLDPKPGPSYQQNDFKRRKTEEHHLEDLDQNKMPPPARNSILKKDAPSKSVFTNIYNNPPPPVYPNVGPSLLKSTVIAQHQMAHGKPIRSIETNNILAGVTNTLSNNGASTVTKAPTPLTADLHSSPPLPDIVFPEIPSDSEDEGDDGWVVPDWAKSPALREQLKAQELVDPEPIFGPIVPLNLEEIFQNKDRHHRFRARTSSANWSGMDRLTEEEIRYDNDTRKKWAENGRWIFSPQ